LTIVLSAKHPPYKSEFFNRIGQKRTVNV